MSKYFKRKQKQAENGGQLRLPNVNNADDPTQDRVGERRRGTQMDRLSQMSGPMRHPCWRRPQRK